MNKENVVYTHNKYYSALKKEKIVLFVEKWIELEIMLLSKIKPTQKEK
jgi:hypothetical protein